MENLKEFTKTPPFTLRSERWDYRSKHDIGYDVATTVSRSNSSNARVEPILLLNGFGVGSFHQHRLVETLLGGGSGTSSKQQQQQQQQQEPSTPTTVYCMDYLGQGRSWPRECRDGNGKDENGLQYSADTWCEQVIDFLEMVVIPSHQTPDDDEKTNTTPCRVHLVGNSVGGHLAAHVALRRPDLVASLCLLNPTPVWGSKLPGWNGHLPAPAIPKVVGRYLFDWIRDPQTIDKVLEAVYTSPLAYSDDDLMQKIRGATMGDGGHAAFASILWSPPLKVNNNGGTRFGDCLKSLPPSLDVCLVFGADDPYCKPAFAVPMLKALRERRPWGREAAATKPAALPMDPVQRYIQISNTGHCPNHEAPKAVGHLVRAWTGATDRSPKGLMLSGSFVEEWVEPNKPQTLEELDANAIPRSWADRIVARFL